MSDIVDRIPAEIQPVDPSDPEYPLLKAISDAGKRNLDFYLQHERELMAKFPGPCTLLVYNGCKVRCFTGMDDLLDFLETLDDVEKSAALEFEQPEPGVVWIL